MCLAVVALIPASVGLVPRLAAQTPALPASGPTAQMISEAKSALDDFKYADALRIARDILQISRLRPAQMVEVSHIMAAAFFPEEGPKPDVDSAVFYLRRAIRLAPEAPLTPDVRWRGLDSLFVATRAVTFASVAKPQSDNALTGTDGRAFIEVISTRPAFMSISTIAVKTGILVQHDSSSGSTRARLALHAHNGTTAVLATGDYEVRIIVRDLVTFAADTMRFAASALGVAPVLDAVPALEPSLLRPERAPLARAKGIVTGVFVGAATVALARYARAPKPVSDAYAADGRATFVGVVLAIGAGVGGFLDKGRPIDDIIAANLLVKAEAQKRAAAVIEANRHRVADYRVELKIEPEVLR